ncbi:T6SS immunity protein Tli4 family protein [Pseudomonas sp. GW456-L15]|uniref:T6SS immunity protein Tli4 family protein n=1 Tax=Pseudomonas sp. GW456-L15 TaxID=2751353 RepID=UPI001A92F014|nr:T6SS immunity protein Tli4 family protein [Pseudomonas sp. GW456-L15]
MICSKRLLTILALVALSSVASCTSLPSSRSPTMDKTGWITHCFGRFLIDLPPESKINAGYYLWGDNIETLDDTPATLAARIDQREHELRGLRHNTKGSMFLRRIEHGNGSASLWSWDSKASALTYRVDSYLVSTPQWAAYRYSGEVTHDREKGGVEVANLLAHNLHSREPTEIPSRPGFCIDRAYIAGNRFQSERFDIAVTFPNYPDAHFEFSSSTGAEQDRLLDRVGGFLAGAARTLTGIETLRKRERGGPVPADEYLLAASDKGQRVYTFAWEAQGKNESLTEPNISAALGVLERSPDKHGNPPPPAFKSDREALELWDAIIDSIRLRPVS